MRLGGNGKLGGTNWGIGGKLGSGGSVGVVRLGGFHDGIGGNVKSGGVN